MAIVDVQDIAKYGLAFEWAKRAFNAPVTERFTFTGTRKLALMGSSSKTGPFPLT